jgi:CubicO group peptidase (beta-lactamase class C family)
MSYRIHNAAFLLLLAFLVGCASPALQPAASPEEVGFSSQRLKEMAQAFQSKVDAGEIPGAVLLVARDNKVVMHEAIGFRDREERSPMPKDALFRMASMTKPLTSLSIMMLQEDGKLTINDHVSRYLPEFKNMKVGVEKADAAGKVELVLEPATREITILDLLRHTSGITYGFIGKGLVKDLYNASKLFSPSQSSAEFATKIAKLPLRMQPATAWEYSMSTDVLARVVEVVSGKSKDQFVRERILDPLRMTQTSYWVEPANHHRIAEPQALKTTGKRPAFPDVNTKPNWIPGGHGLISTASDYARFCQMLLNGGALDGVRLASPDTIAMMRSNHLTSDIAVSPEWNAFGVVAPTPENGQSFGLGFTVRVSEGKNNLPGSVGDFSWAGIQGTYFWVDPKERLFAILMLQEPPPANAIRRVDMRKHVYGALQKH